jgi:CheY-like chemotaxis protein
MSDFGDRSSLAARGCRGNGGGRPLDVWLTTPEQDLGERRVSRTDAGLGVCDRLPMRTLLIVDDHASFRAVVRAALSEAFTVVGEAADGTQAVALVRELRPDVVLLDVQLPDADGFDVAALLAGEDHPPVVVLTSSRDRRDFESLLQQSPARGFVEKERLSAGALAELIS